MARCVSAACHGADRNGTCGVGVGSFFCVKCRSRYHLSGSVGRVLEHAEQPKRCSLSVVTAFVVSADHSHLWVIDWFRQSCGVKGWIWPLVAIPGRLQSPAGGTSGAAGLASGGGAQGRGDASNGQAKIVSGLSLYGSRRLPKGMGQFGIVIRWPLPIDRGVFS